MLLIDALIESDRAKRDAWTYRAESVSLIRELTSNGPTYNARIDAGASTPTLPAGVPGSSSQLDVIADTLEGALEWLDAHGQHDLLVSDKWVRAYNTV
ncbi:MAG TPA: hypothetical protein VF120_14280 [Ktedonobacterales bacterium]